MRKEQLTTKERAVVDVLSNQHLTSTEILTRAQKIPHILKLYSILDKLRNKGVIESYMKEGVKYHYAA